MINAEWILKYQVQFDFKRSLWPLNNSPIASLPYSHVQYVLCLGVAWPDPTVPNSVIVGPGLWNYLENYGTFKRWGYDGSSESVRQLLSVSTWLHFLSEFSLLSGPLRWRLNNSVSWAQIKLHNQPWLPCHSCHFWLCL